MSLKIVGVVVCFYAALITSTRADNYCVTTSDCGANANCVTGVCACYPGYTGDGLTCSSLCTMADVLLGTTYHALPGECGRYVTCDGVIPHVQYCGYGTFWNDDIQACVTPANANCGMCTGQPDGVQLTNSLLCNSYWQCQGGIAQVMCCPENTSFVQGSGCVSGSCSDTCPPQVSNSTAEPCVYTPSDDGPEYYMETVFGFGLVRRNCPAGTTFSDVTCGCHGVVTMAPDTSSVCPSKADISYDTNMRTFTDNSVNNIWIQINNVALGNEPVFTGSSSLALYALAGVTYGSHLEIILVFSVNPATSLDNQVLLQNGQCNEPFSFFVWVTDSSADSSLMALTLILMTGNSELAINSTLTISKSTKVRMELEYPSRSDSSVYTHSVINDDTNVTVTSNSDVMPATATIPRKYGALKAGGTDCADYSGFTGSIYRVGIRSCPGSV